MSIFSLVTVSMLLRIWLQLDSHEMLAWRVKQQLQSALFQQGACVVPPAWTEP